MSKDLRTFLQQVRSAGPGYYVEAKKPLDPRYEVAVLQHKLASEGRYPVIYCPRVVGSHVPLVTNLVPRYEALALAMDISLERVRTDGKGIIVEEYRRRRGSPVAPKEVPSATAPVHEVVLKGKDVDLGVLPLTWHAEGNPERYVPIGITMTVDPETGEPNGGIYRMQVLGKSTIACMMVPRPTKQGNLNALRHARLGKPMEAVTWIGHHPMVIAGALNFGRPQAVPEFEYTGGLLGEPLEVTQGMTVKVPLPARAEVAIEGVIEPSRMGREGPFSEMGGYYGEGEACYVIEITAITMRRDAVYQDLQPTHQESSLIAILPREAAVYDRVKTVVPTVKAVHLGPEGPAAKGMTYVAIKKTSEEDVVNAGRAALAEDVQAKIAVVVDDDIDVYNEPEVLWAMSTRTSRPPAVFDAPERKDTPVRPGSRRKTGLDLARSTKVLLDATWPLNAPVPARVTFPDRLWKSMRTEDYIPGN